LIDYVDKLTIRPIPTPINYYWTSVM